ncbi:MAG: hypothetical protein KGH74_03630 [Candidatus Micrarchaeota archaeon]|nr:hypothetical protein [Candidatus Micrarchaeota archaeon]
MKATCPNCGTEFDAKRRPMGAGTAIDSTIPLSYTESQVYRNVDAAHLDVRGIQDRLIAVGIRKNYHQCQAALSTLVGRRMVNMDVSVFPPRYWKD